LMANDPETGDLHPQPNRYVRVRGAREHNLKDVDVGLTRDSLVVFSGILGSGKSSLAFGTLYAKRNGFTLNRSHPMHAA